MTKPVTDNKARRIDQLRDHISQLKNIILVTKRDLRNYEFDLETSQKELDLLVMQLEAGL